MDNELANVSLGILTIMARILDSHRELSSKLSQAKMLHNPTIEAFTLQVIARMKKGQEPTSKLFDEVHKHFLS